MITLIYYDIKIKQIYVPYQTKNIGVEQFRLLFSNERPAVQLRKTNHTPSFITEEYMA